MARTYCIECNGFGSFKRPGSPWWKFWQRDKCRRCSGDGWYHPPGYPDHAEMDRLMAERMKLETNRLLNLSAGIALDEAVAGHVMGARTKVRDGTLGAVLHDIVAIKRGRKPYSTNPEYAQLAARKVGLEMPDSSPDEICLAALRKVLCG